MPEDRSERAEDIHHLLAESDIFVLSSRREGQSNVLLEALACRCAVVATRCSGVEEVIHPGKNGFIVEIEDTHSMAEKIDLLAKEKQTREALALAGRHLIETEFRLQSKIDDLMNLYEAILSLPPPKAGSPALHMFIHQATEISILGTKQLEMEQRLRKAERLSALVLGNFVVRTLRSLRNRISG